MRSLVGSMILLCAACSGESISGAQFSDGQFVDDTSDPGYDAVRAEVGTLPWKHIEWQHQFNNRPIARMTMGGGHLYVETPDHTIISVDRFTGRTEWIYKIDTETPLDWAPIEAAGAPEEIRQYELELAKLASQIDDMIKEKGVGPETRKVQQKRQEVRERLRVAAFGDNVYFISRQVLYCVDRLSGNLRWTHRLGFVPAAQPYAIRPYVFIPGADLSRVWKLDVETKGSEVDFFKSDLDNRENHIMNRPLVSLPSLYFVCHDGGIYRVPATGSVERLKYSTQAKIKADPILHNHFEITKDDKGKERVQATKILFVGSSDFGFYALDADSMGQVWKYETGADMKTPATAKDKTVYVKTEEGALHALEVMPMHRDPKTGAAIGVKRNGNLRWKLPLGERFLVKGADRVYVLGPRREIFGMKEMTGEVLGRHRTEYLQHLITNTSDGFMYVANAAGYIFCLKESKEEF